jgi:hypothetical protein
MSKSNQQKPGNINPKQTNSKPIGISKAEVGRAKNGRVTSEAPTRPEKPSKGNK